MGKKILLVAHDMAPSRCFSLLLDSLLSMGHIVSVVLGNGEDPGIGDTTLSRYVAASNFVLVGMSSQEQFAAVELKALAYAKERGVPYGFYSDTPFVVNRARPGMWFYEYADGARLVLGLMHKGAVQIFPNAYIVQTGNPLREAISFPKFSREMTRSKLDLSVHDVLVQVVGGKFCAGNCATLMLVADAVSRIPNCARWHVVFTPHPGDPALKYPARVTEGVPDVYNDICRYTPTLVQIKLKEEMSSSEVLAGADVVIEFTGSTSLEGAYQSIPALSISFMGAEMFYESEGGTFPLELLCNGAAHSIEPDVYKLAQHLQDLITVGHPMRERMLMRQRKSYPIQTEHGVVIRKMTDELMVFLK
jgi:hypothetical protein